GFADQNWLVLCPPTKHLNYSLDLIAPANYWIEFSLPRQLRQITAKCAKCWSLNIFLRWFDAFLFRFRRREVWIKFLENLVARAFDIEFETLEHSGGDPLAFAQKPKQNMFSADVRMIERLGFLARKRQHLFYPGRVGNVTDYLVSGPDPTCFSTSIRTVSRSRPIFCKTFTATPCPSWMSPNSR